MQKNVLYPLSSLLILLAMLMSTNLVAYASNTTSPVPAPKSFEFTPIADTYINEASANINFGKVSSMRVDISPVMKSYLRFTVQGLDGKAVNQAFLLVYANSSSDQGLIVNPVEDNSWDEFSLNYTNAPPANGNPLASPVMVSAGSWITMDVTSFITGDGTYSFSLSTPGPEAIGLRSRESGQYSPKLIITVDDLTTTLVPPVPDNSAVDDTFSPSVTDGQVTTLSSPEATATNKFSLMIPAYFYPGIYWSRLINLGKSGDVVIVNPNDGPGSAIDPLIQGVYKQARTKNITLAGYIFTGYGKRDIKLVKNQIDRYFRWYGVTSIFLDEVSDQKSVILYYRDLYQYIKQRGGLVIINPGACPDELYMRISDIVMTVETSYSNYITKTFPAWIAKYPASRFAHVIHTASLASSTRAINMAKNRNAGYVYVTDDINPNPWDKLPSYWTQEIAQIRLINSKLTVP